MIDSNGMIQIKALYIWIEPYGLQHILLNTVLLTLAYIKNPYLYCPTSKNRKFHCRIYLPILNAVFLNFITEFKSGSWPFNVIGPLD